MAERENNIDIPIIYYIIGLCMGVLIPVIPCIFFYSNNLFLYILGGVSVLLGLMYVIALATTDSDYNFDIISTLLIMSICGMWILSPVVLGLYTLIHVSGSIFVAGICISVLFVTLYNFCSRYTFGNSNQKKRALVRKAYKYSITVIALIASMVFIIPIFNQTENSLKFSFADKFAIYVLNIPFLILIVSNMVMQIKTYDKKYRKKNFILFLRAFNLDTNNENNIIKSLKRKFKRINVIKIGDPKYIVKETYGEDVFYLPDEQWKIHVENLMETSLNIFINIDCPTENNSTSKITQGVLWEIFNHQQFYAKTIFHISDISLLDMSDMYAYNDTVLYKAVSLIKKTVAGKYNNCYLIILDKVCIFSKEFIVPDEFNVENGMLTSNDESGIQICLLETTRKCIPAIEISVSESGDKDFLPAGYIESKVSSKETEKEG